MELKVDRKPIDEWVDKNGPDGLVKLAQLAGVSSSLMNKVRSGFIPKKESTRIRICNALKKDIFLFAPTKGNRAS